MRQSISPQRLQLLIALLEDGKEHQFYNWPEWRELQQYVSEELDHCECQECKRQGRYSRGYIVHHRKHLRDRPDLALSIYDPDTGERQLETLCKRCHEKEHPESLRSFGRAVPPITEERWD